MEWKQYIGDRLIAQHDSGFYVIKPRTLHESGRPVFCPVCEVIMSSAYDDESYDKFECCDDCANSWVYKDVPRWKSGWRPSPDDLLNNCRRSHI